MDRYNRAPFSSAGSYRCVRPFVMNGTAYAMGDPVESDGIEIRRLRQMYEMRMIEMYEGGEAPVSKPATPKKASAKKEVAPEPSAQTQTEGAQGLRAEHRGFGKWFLIDAAGSDVEGPMNKSDALRRAAEVTT